MFVLVCKRGNSSPHKIYIAVGAWKSLGSSYFNKLEVGKMLATSHRMINELLSILSDCTDTEILCVEPNDVANLKQLVVFVCYLIIGKPCTSFVKIVDLMDGTAENTERA